MTNTGNSFTAAGLDHTKIAIITHRYRLDQIEDAVEMMAEPDRLKVMVYPNPDLYSGE